MVRAPHLAPRAAGFTLAEVAITLLIVGMCLMYVLQGLNTSRLSALHTYQTKVAREMATLTISQVEAGLYWEDLDGSGDMLQGTYAEEGYEDYLWELVFGDDQEFSIRLEEDLNQDPEPTDTYRYGKMLEKERRADAGEDDEDAIEEPYEKVRVRVVLETQRESRVLITLERWIPWALVYGEGEEESSEEPIE